MYIQHAVHCTVCIRVSLIWLRIWVTGKTVTLVKSLYTLYGLYSRQSESLTASQILHGWNFQKFLDGVYFEDIKTSTKKLDEKRIDCFFA